LVGSAAWWILGGVEGTRAGLIGGLVVMAAHEMLDAPVARRLDRFVADL